MGIAIFTAHKLFGSHVSQTTWFCWSNVCFQGKARRSIVSLASVRDALPVMQGTGLTGEAVDFWVQNGVVVQGFERDINYIGASLIDLRIIVNTFKRKLC